MDKKKTLIYLVRHGETDWNVQKRMQGTANIPLNTTGQKQAGAIANHLKTIKVDVIFASPLSRAQETAKNIAAYHPNVSFITDSLLIERGFGEMEGKTHEEFDALHLGLNWKTSWLHPHSRPTKGESLNDVHNRASVFLQKILTNYASKTIVIVSHGVTIRLLLGVITKTPISHLGNFETRNASVTMLEYSDIHGPFFHFSDYVAEIEE